MIPKPKTEAEKNQLLFMAWLAKQNPAVYNAFIAKRDADIQLSGFFDSITAGISALGRGLNTVLQKAPDLIAQYGATKEQLALIKANLERARAGQPPLNPNGTPVTAAQTAPTIPATDTGKLLPVPTSFLADIPPLAWLGIGVGLYLLVRRF